MKYGGTEDLHEKNVFLYRAPRRAKQSGTEVGRCGGAAYCGIWSAGICGGHYGMFDSLAANAVKAAKEHHPDTQLILLRPYHPAERGLLRVSVLEQ